LNQYLRSYAEQDHGLKWYKRYSDEGIKGLRDRPRSGKPSAISKEVKERIGQELANSNIGWDIKQVMDLVQKRTGVKYHKEHIRRLLHQWVITKGIAEKVCKHRASKKEKDSFKKGYKTS
jgi:transposase